MAEPGQAAAPRVLAALTVPAAVVASNAIAYALVLLAARLLTHDQYGSFVVLTTIMVVGAIPSLALQAVAARRTAAGEGTDGLWAVTWWLALGSAGALAALAVPLRWFLNIDSLPATFWLAAGLVPSTLLGPLIGIAQGAERLLTFAGLSLMQAAGRFGGCLVMLVATRSEAAALAGAAVGSAVVAAGAVPVLRRAGLTTPRARGSDRSVLVETGHAFHGYAAILLMTSLDLFLARHVLGGEQAAQYAAGTVVTRVVVWLPQSIGLIVFARMAAHEHHYRVVRRAIAVVALIGLLATGGSAIFHRVVSAVVGGQFDVLTSSAWIFALLGTALAVLQLTVVAGLAARSSGRLVVMWSAMALEVVAVLLLSPSATATDVVEVVTSVVAIAAAVAVWLAAGLPVAGRDRQLRTP